jgi:hypothetical protein
MTQVRKGMDNPRIRCPKCANTLNYRIERNWIGRNLLFFIPVELYFCVGCFKHRYVIIGDALTFYKAV